MRRALIGCLGPLVLAEPVLAEPGASAGRAETQRGIETGSAAALDSPVAITVEASGYEVDTFAVRAAIATELGLAVAEEGAEARTLVSVLVEKDRDLVVVLKRARTSEVKRTIAAPGRPDEVPEAASLLIGNMARDESAALLAGLLAGVRAQPVPAASAAAPVPETSAEPSPPRQKESAEAGLARRPYNLSLFHPFSLHENSDELEISVEAGLVYSRLGALDGVAVNILGITQVDGAARGAQFSLFGNINSGAGTGARLAGFFNYGNPPLVGVAAAGLYNQHGGGVGATLSGLATVSEGAYQGAQVSGLTSIQGGAISGVQVSGLASIAAEDVSGSQISGLFNFAQDVSGVQIGLVNIASRVSGLQLGLVNIADEVEGASIALVPYSRTGKVQWVNWVSSAQWFNTGVRMHTGPIYVMPTVSGEPRGHGNTVFAPGFSFGGRIPLSRFYADLDLNYSRLNVDSRFVKERMDFLYQGLMGFKVAEGFSAFAGGGLRHRLFIPDLGRGRVDSEFSAGFELF